MKNLIIKLLKSRKIESIKLAMKYNSLSIELTEKEICEYILDSNWDKDSLNWFILDNLAYNPFQYVTRLNLIGAKIHWKKLNDIPYSINRLNNLKELNVCCNQFESIPDSIKYIESLTILRFYNQSINSVPTWIFNMNLSILDLSNNSIDTIDNSISNMKNLLVLNLNDNPIQSLPESISTLKQLKEIHLQGTLIHHDEIKKLKQNLDSTIFYF